LKETTLPHTEAAGSQHNCLEWQKKINKVKNEREEYPSIPGKSHQRHILLEGNTFAFLQELDSHPTNADGKEAGKYREEWICSNST